MIRALVLALIGTFGFTLGVGVNALKDALFPPKPLERIVYCPIGTTDKECVEARRRYDAGQASLPSTQP